MHVAFVVQVRLVHVLVHDAAGELRVATEDAVHYLLMVVNGVQLDLFDR